MIFINARFLTQPITGVQRFAIEISIRLKKELGNEVQFVAPNNIIYNELHKNLNVQIIGATRGYIWEQFTLPNFLKKKKNPILLNLCNTAPLLYKNNIVTIHDLAFLENPEWFSFQFRTTYKFLIPKIARNAKHIITVSNFSKNEIINKIGIKTNNISIVNNSVNNKLVYSEIISTDFEPYILFVGSMDARKNLIRLMEAMQYVPNTIKLKVVGGINNNFNTNYHKIVEDKNYCINFVGRVSDEKLFELYKNAIAFVYPSLYEGFGIPPLESQAMGCPIILSNIPVFKEIFGDSALFCDALNPKDIAKKINEILNWSDSERKIMIEKGRINISKYTWEKSVDQIIDILKIKELWK